MKTFCELTCGISDSSTTAHEGRHGGRFKTNVYATRKRDGELVWTGVSDSFNLRSAKKVADARVEEIPKRMRQKAAAD